MNLTLARVIGLCGALGAGLTAFASNASTGYRSAAVAAFSAVVAVWLHEEHATERNATTAAASLKVATPAPGMPPEAVQALHDLGGLLEAIPGASSALAHSAQPAPQTP